MADQKETVFNNIRSFVQKEVNNVISSHLNNKNYNVNDAQIWTNQICDDVHTFLSRFSKTSPASTRTSSSLPIALLCRKLIVDSTFLAPASGIIKWMELSLLNGMLLLSSVSSMSSDALSEMIETHLYHKSFYCIIITCKKL